jgi:integrase
MPRAKDLWFTKDRKKTAKHPDNGGGKNAKRWLACWINPDGREETKAFAKQSDAKTYADKMEADATRGEYIDKDAGKQRFGDVARKWLRLRDVGGSSMERYQSVFRIHVEPVFGKRQVGAILPSEIAEWLQKGDISKLSDVMKEAAYFIVAGAFDLAVADKMCRDNPARHDVVKVPRVEPKERAVWPTELVWKVRDEHPGPYRAVVDCEAGLGLRRGCAFGLAVDDLDFEEGTVRIRRQVAWVGHRWVFKLPKGGKERTVPLSRGVAASLRAHMDEYPSAACALPWMDEKGNLGETVTVKLIFVWRGGGRNTGKQGIRKKTYGKAIAAGSYEQGVWKPALSRAGIIPPPEKNARGTYVYRTGGATGNGQHVLRHFYQTMLDDGGVSLAGRMEFMGHSKKGKVVTVASYGHVTAETFERARLAVDATLFRLRKIESSGTVTELRAAQ